MLRTNNIARWMIFGLLAVAAGCAAPGLKDQSTVDLTKEAVFVIGVSPQSTYLSIRPIKLRNGKMFEDTMRGAVVADSPNHGYLVGTAEPEDILGLTLIAKEVKSAFSPPESGWWGPCEGINIFHFSIPAGKVVYLADMQFYFLKSSVNTKYSRNFENAKRFMEAHYPALAGRLEQWPYDLTPYGQSCTL